MTRYILIALLLAGCGVTPNQIREGDKPYLLGSKQPPEKAGYCILRNLEEFDAIFRGQMRPKEPGFELIGHNPQSPVLVVDIQPANGGSRLSLWLSHHWIGYRDQMVEKLMKGC